MTYEEARKKAANVPWKVVNCLQGQPCWCRVIMPRRKIEYEAAGGVMEEYDIIGAGAVDKKTARRIVSDHNKMLEHAKTKG
jgi:hypothetical protein